MGIHTDVHHNPDLDSPAQCALSVGFVKSVAYRITEQVHIDLRTST